MAMNTIGNCMFNLMLIRTREPIQSVFRVESCGFVDGFALSLCVHKAVSTLYVGGDVRLPHP